MSGNEPESVTGAPKFDTIGGEELQIYPLSDRDHETVINWVRREYLRRVEILAPTKAVLDAAISKAVTLNPTDDAFGKILSCEDGGALLLGLLTRKDPADCKSKIKTLDDIRRIFRHYVSSIEAVKN